MCVEPDNGGNIKWGHEQWRHHGIQGSELMVASADHPIGRRLEIGDLTVSARWPIPVWKHRMAMRNQARVRVELERAIMPENQRQISSRYCVPRADLPQVRVVD